MAIRKITVTPTAVSDQDNTSDGFFEIPQGSTAQRPSSPSIGQIRFNTDSNLMEQYNGTGWIVLTSPPTVASISPTTFNGEQGTTITVTGTNFVSGDTTVVFIDNGGNEFTAGSTSFVSSTEVTATTPQDFTVSQEPFDVKVTTSAGSATLEDALDAGGTPAWSTSAGSIGTFESETAVSETLVATDPDSGATITYAVTSGALPTGVTLNSDGTITGTTPDEDTTTQYNFTVTATDNAGNTADRAFSMTVNLAADANFSSTTLLINADGASDGDQNNTFVDSSTNTHTITRNGNPTQGSFSPFSQDEGKWGNYFDGTGDYLDVPQSSDFDFGTGDFTLEAWVYHDNTSQYTTMIDARPTSSSSGWSWYFEYSKIAIDGTVSTSDVPSNTWSHIAITRESGTLRIFIDGSLDNSASDSNSKAASEDIRIGTKRYSASGQVPYTGNISNLRLVKGTAVYTSSFTPSTTPLTDITNTSLLTCQSNRFVDNSSNAHSITVAGDPEVTPFSPFAPSTAYDPATKGGSGYFDGTDDKLLTDTRLAIGTQDFTMEAWVYLQSGGDHIIVGEHWSGTAGGFIFRQFDNDYLSFYDGTTNQNTTTVLPKNAWQHVACTRSGTTLRIFVNGTEVLSTTSSSSLTGPNSGEVLSVGGVSNSSLQTWDGYLSDVRVVVGTAVYTSAFTPPTSPVSAVSGTSLLCNFTNASIVDETGRNVIETVGNAQIDTAVKKYGTGSMQFDGTGDYLDFPSSDLFAFGTGDFTVEFWINKGSGDSQVVMDTRSTTSSSDGFVITIFNGQKISYYTSSTSQAEDPTALVEGTWIHYAIARSSGTTRLFRDGTLVATKTSDTFDFTYPNLRIGDRLASTGVPLNGSLDDIRITKGVARYTAGFTPPTKTFALR